MAEDSRPGKEQFGRVSVQTANIVGVKYKPSMGKDLIG